MNYSFLTLAAVSALALVPLQATAGTITIDYDPTSYSATNGGEFKVTEFSGGGLPTQGSGVQVSGGYYQSFCLEYSERIDAGVQYNWTVSDTAREGGGSVAKGASQDSLGWGDALDARTAYLYTQFWNGTLSWTTSAGVLHDYDYTLGSGRVASATALQQAIWYIENEQSLSDIGGSDSEGYRMVVAAQSAIDSGAWAGLGNVRVLNLTTSSGGFAQDQLIMVPLPPAALAGLGLLGGLAAFGIWRRRRTSFAF